MISSAIGVYFAWKDRQNDDENNYALAGQTFSAWPVSLRNDFIDTVMDLRTAPVSFRRKVFGLNIFSKTFGLENPQIEKD